MSHVKPRHLRFCQSITTKGHQCKLHCSIGFVTCHIHTPKTATCDICMSHNISLLKYIELPCKHSLCVDCLKQWKEKGKHTCPFCRKYIVYTTKECTSLLSNLINECTNCEGMFSKVKVLDDIFNVLSTPIGQMLLHNNTTLKNVVCMKLREYDTMFQNTIHYELVKVWHNTVC